MCKGLTDEDQSVILNPVSCEGEGGEGRVAGDEGGKVARSITRQTVAGGAVHSQYRDLNYLVENR